MNGELVLLAFCIVAFLFGLAVGRFSLKQELTYLRNYHENRQRLERMEGMLNA